MKKFVISISIALLVSVLLSDVHMLIYYLYPETSSIELSLWLDKSYTQKINVLWYIYEQAMFLKYAIWLFCFAQTARLVSYTLFKILVIFFMYYLTQFLFYLWDRNTSFISNIIVYIYMTFAVIQLFIPDKKGGKLINIQDY